MTRRASANTLTGHSAPLDTAFRRSLSAWRQNLEAAVRANALSYALAVSILAHAAVLAIHFEVPRRLGKSAEHALDVILVNAASAHRPDQAQARAQANLDGGGESDEERRAKTSLPQTLDAQSEDELTSTQRRVRQMEAEMRRLLTQTKSAHSVRPDTRSSSPQPDPPSESGQDLAANALASMRLEAQIDREVSQYNQRPHKKFLGVRSEEYRFAQYMEAWRQKVERIGNLNYPEAARGKFYGRLVMSVTLNASGDVKSIIIERSSGYKILDDAARRIVLLAAPYPAFPPAIARDTDEIEITRAWSFTNGDQLLAE